MSSWEFSSYTEGVFSGTKIHLFKFVVKYLNFGATSLSFGAMHLSLGAMHLSFGAKI